MLSNDLVQLFMIEKEPVEICSFGYALHIFLDY